MRKQIALLFILFSSSLLAESTEDVINEIFESIVAESTELQQLPKLLEQTRTTFIDSFKPEYEVKKEAEIIALEEQLYLEVKSSAIYEGYMNGLKKAYEDDLRTEFTFIELVELRDLLTNPLFKKLKNIQLSKSSSGMKFLSEWNENNEKLSNQFLERKKQIIYQEKVKFMMNANNQSQLDK